MGNHFWAPLSSFWVSCFAYFLCDFYYMIPSISTITISKYFFFLCCHIWQKNWEQKKLSFCYAWLNLCFKKSVKNEFRDVNYEELCNLKEILNYIYNMSSNKHMSLNNESDIYKTACSLFWTQIIFSSNIFNNVYLIQTHTSF